MRFYFILRNVQDALSALGTFPSFLLSILVSFLAILPLQIFKEYRLHTRTMNSPCPGYIPYVANTKCFQIVMSTVKKPNF